MRISEFFRKVQFPLMIAMGTYSVGACISAYFAPELLQYIWLFPGVYFLFAAVGLLLPGKLRIMLSALGAAALLWPVVQYTQGNARMLGLVLGVCYSALTLWSMSMGGWEQEKEIPGGWLGACLVILLIGSFFATFEQRMQHLLPWIKVMLFAFVLLAMLSLNRRSRTLASGGRQTYSASMRSKNTLLTLGMFAIALGIALIPSLFDLLEAIYEWIAGLIAKLVEMIPEETEPTTTPPTTESYSGPGMEGLFDKVKPQNTPLRVYIIMAVVAIGVMIPLVFFAARKLYRIVRDAIRKLYHTVTDGVTLDADFQDEITDTRADGQSAYSRKKREPGKPKPDIRRMTPVQRVRYQYKLVAKRHPHWGEQTTARENLTEEAAQIYEKARYSDHAVTAEDVERFNQQTRPETEPW